MALENSNDEKIKDLLENNYPLKAVAVDFAEDINNMNLVVRTSFKRAEYFFDHTNEKSSKYDNWFYIAELNPYSENIKICGLVRMTLTAANGYLNISHLEKNRVLKEDNLEKRIIDYFKGYSKFKHLKGIRLFYDKADIPNEEIARTVKVYEDNGFKRNEGTLTFTWENK